jgi:hypothetical protein
VLLLDVVIGFVSVACGQAGRSVIVRSRTYGLVSGLLCLDPGN